MVAIQATAVPVTMGLFEVPKKVTVIRLRWLLVIICSYLLISSHGTWLTPAFLHGFIFFYLLTNFALYFIDEGLFDATYFYSPLVIFDTMSVTATLVMSGQVETDFYLVYFLVVILCTIWQDFRGLVVVAALSTLLYGYFLFVTPRAHDPSIYLRIPFLFVVSLFYGYFAQVVRTEKALKEQAEQEARDMAMVHSLSQSLPSSLDYKQVLDTVREKIHNAIRPAKLYLFMMDDEHSSRANLVAGEEDSSVPKEVDLQAYPVIQECIQKRNPVVQHELTTKFSSVGSVESKGFAFPTSVAVPIAFRGELHGVILLGFTEDDRVLGSREIQFCQIVAFATAIALNNAKRYEALQAEARRRQIIAEQLAEANRLKSEFLANTTHELRTPIAAVVGYGDLLLEGVFGPLSDEQRNTMVRMTENARGLLGIVEEILDYSKLERGETPIFTRQQDIGPLIDELRRDLAPFVASKTYKVKYEVDEGIPLIRTDWGKLKRVLLNLLSNAIKFTDQGEVRLTVKNKASGEVSFIVSDTGIGMAKDQIPLIFEKFRQLDGSTARRYGGTGLGLTISKNLVDLLGGKLEVESEVGKGSVFTVTIPANSEAPAGAIQASAQ